MIGSSLSLLSCTVYSFFTDQVMLLWQTSHWSASYCPYLCQSRTRFHLKFIPFSFVVLFCIRHWSLQFTYVGSHVTWLLTFFFFAVDWRLCCKTGWGAGKNSYQGFPFDSLEMVVSSPQPPVWPHWPTMNQLLFSGFGFFLWVHCLFPLMIEYKSGSSFLQLLILEILPYFITCTIISGMKLPLFKDLEWFLTYCTLTVQHQALIEFPFYYYHSLHLH